MRKVSLDQSSDDWLVWRSKGIGASDASAIMGAPGAYNTWTGLLADKLAHWDWHLRATNKKKTGSQMRGTRLEPVARDAYIRHTGIMVVPACVIHEKYDWMRCSLDGLSEDDLTAVEIKCIKEEYHRDAVEGFVPTVYYPQVQHQLACMGLPSMHYWSYSENTRFRERDRQIKLVVKRHEGYIDRLIKAEKAFWAELKKRVEERKQNNLTSPEKVVE